MPTVSEPAELTDLEQQIALIDALLAPIANTPVDSSDPDWMTRCQNRDTLREAGVKEEAHAALRAALAVYADGDEATRTVVRGWFNRYTSFRWAVHIPLEPTPEGIRFELLHFSAEDQGADTRDALLAIRDLYATAREAGIDIAPLLVEAAELSSDVDKYGMGSTRGILLGLVGT
jgi:hypothetical protein